MKTFFTADPHFGHARIIELADRPFETVEEMNEALLEGINSTVSSSQRLVILGDVCMGKLDDSLPLLARIRAAELVLVPGNHDRWSLAYHHSGDAAAKRNAFVRRYEAQRETIYCLDDRTPSAWTYEEITAGEGAKDSPLHNAMFSHYPYDGDSHGEDRYGHLREPRVPGWPIIHGHVHGEWDVKDVQFNVGVDVREFKPVSDEELADWVSSLS